MKSTFAFIDKLIILLKYVPTDISTPEEQKKAEKVIVLLEEYTTILRSLVNNHKIKENLVFLHNKNKEIAGWTEQVNTTLKQMNSLLSMLNNDIKALAPIVRKGNSDAWNSTCSNMAFGMYRTGLHKEEFEMSEEEKILDELIKTTVIFDEKELTKIINHEKHASGLNKWQTFAKLSEDKQILEHEKFFAKLLR